MQFRQLLVRSRSLGMGGIQLLAIGGLVACGSVAGTRDDAGPGTSDGAPPADAAPHDAHAPRADAQVTCETQGLFDCGDGNCVPLEWVCDQWNDCETGADEGEAVGCACTGCLDGDWCRPGDDDDVCGAGGSACVRCELDESCMDGACVGTPTCGPGTCDGCCDGNYCVTPPTSSRCGSGGWQCQDCGSGSCFGGSCVQTCGPESCGGCCDDNGTCVDGTSAGACGGGGSACNDCGELECAAGTCVEVDCLASCDGCCDGSTCRSGVEHDMCGWSGELCGQCAPLDECVDALDNGVSGYCWPPESARFRLVLISAELSETNVDGEAWDAWGGLPDPKLRVWMMTAGDSTIYQAYSSVQQDTRLPYWGGEVLFQDLPADAFDFAFQFTMIDSDAVGDDHVGSCPPYGGYGSVPSAPVDFSGAIVECSRPRDLSNNQAGFKVRYRIERQ